MTHMQTAYVVLIQTFAKPKLMVVRMAIIKGAGLDFIKERAAAARHPEINVIGTKLLLIMPTRLVVLVLNPASDVLETPKASYVSAKKAKAKKARLLICSGVLKFVLSFSKVFILGSPVVDEWIDELFL